MKRSLLFFFPALNSRVNAVNEFVNWVDTVKYDKAPLRADGGAHEEARSQFKIWKNLATPRPKHDA